MNKQQGNICPVILHAKYSRYPHCNGKITKTYLVVPDDKDRQLYSMMGWERFVA